MEGIPLRHAKCQNEKNKAAPSKTLPNPFVKQALKSDARLSSPKPELRDDR